MQQDYYIEYFDLERKHWWFTARMHLLETQVKLMFPKHEKQLAILNVGAATGATSLMLEKFGSVTSVEYDKECCDFVFVKTGLRYVNASIEQLPFNDDSYDLVCAFDVLEHVEHDKIATQELARVCKPQGYVFATVPAFLFLWGVHDEVNHHKRRYTLNEFEKLFPVSLDFLYKSYFNTILFVPIAIARILMRAFPKIVKRKGSGVDNYLLNSSWINKVFYHVFKSENLFLIQKIRMPFGISIMMVMRKP